MTSSTTVDLQGIVSNAVEASMRDLRFAFVNDVTAELKAAVKRLIFGKGVVVTLIFLATLTELSAIFITTRIFWRLLPTRLFLSGRLLVRSLMP